MKPIRALAVMLLTGLTALALASTSAAAAATAKELKTPPATAAKPAKPKTPATAPAKATSKPAPKKPTTPAPAKAAPKPAPKPPAKPEPVKVPPKVEPKPPVKPAPKPPAKPEPVKVPPKVEPKPPVKPAPKPPAKPEPVKVPPKVEPKPPVKPEPAKPEPKPLVKAQPATAPAKPLAATTTRPAPRKPGERNIIFSFDGMPYMDVIRWFAQEAGKPMIGGINIPGSLTFFDSQPYTYEEALATLNIILSMRGHYLLESGRFLKVVPLAAIPQEQSIKILKGLDDAEVRGAKPDEIVTVLLPLKFVDADTASKIVVRMVSAYGFIAPLSKGKGLIITDHLSNIRRISALLKALDAEELVDQQIKSIQLKRASAKAVADIINKLFGQTSSSSYNRYSSYSRYSSYRPSTTASTAKDSIQAAYDERTNMIFLKGAGDKLAMAEQMIERLDSKDLERQSDMKIIEIKNARAEDVVKTLNPLLPMRSVSYGSGHGSREVPVARVIADSSTNRLIVSAPIDVMSGIEETIKKLDTASEVTGGMKIFQLKVAEATQLAPIITAALVKESAYSRSSYYRRSSSSGSSASVTADSRTNSLIVMATATELKTAEMLIKELDREIGEGSAAREVHVVQLPVGSARTMATTLSRLFTQQYGRRYGASSDQSGIRIESEPSTNALLISCTPSDWTRVKALLDKIIPPPPKSSATATTPSKTTPMTIVAMPGTRIIPLQVAKASEMAETLRSFFATRQRSDRPAPTIVPVARNNTLLVSATETEHEAMAELVRALDVEATEPIDPVDIIELKTADAKKVASTLESLLPPVQRTRRGRAQEVFIIPDTTTNSVIIRAPESHRKMVQELIAKLDKAVIVAREMRIIALKNVPASQMIQVVSQFTDSSTAVSRSWRSRQSSTPDADDRVILTAAPGDAKIIVEAPRKKIEEIAKLIESLDKDESVTRQDIRIYRITEGAADAIAATMTNLFEQRYGSTARRGRTPAPGGELPPRFEVNAAANQLIVSATGPQFEQIEKLLKEIQSRSVLAQESRTFPLKYAQAQEVVTVLNTMLSIGSSGASRYSRGRRPSAPEAELRIAILPGTNSIMIQGPPNKVTQAAQLIESMDTKDVTAAGIQMIKLKNQNAAAVAASLQAMLPPQRGKKRSEEVLIQPDTLTNSILLRAPEAERKMILELIAKIDTVTEGVREMKVIPIQYTSASSLARTIETMYQQFSQVRRGRRTVTMDPSEQIIVSASPDDRSLIVEAPVKKMEEILQLVKKLDTTGATADLLLRTYELKNASATEVAASLGQIFAERWEAERRKNPKDAPPRPTFQVNAATNQLIVGATGKQYEEIEKILAQLEKASVSATATRTFTLQHADAAELVGVLQTMLAGSSRRRSRYGASTAEAEIRISTLSGTNTIVIQGPPDKLAKAEKLIQSFDKPDAEGASLIHIVALENQNATTLAATIQTMLPPPSRRGGSEEISVQPDALTNSLLIRAPQKQRKMVEDLIAKLDKVTAPVREMKVIKVKYTSANQLADAVRQMFQQFQQARSSRRRTTATGDSEQVTVTASPDDKLLIVEAPIKKMPDIVKLVSDLDVKESASELLVRMYQLENANAAELAQSLGEIFSQRWQEERRKNPAGAAPRPTFEVNSATNQLIVGATTVQLEKIEETIAGIEKSAVRASATETFELKHANADDLVPVLNTMLTSSSPSYSRRSRGASADAGVRIAAMPGANTIVAQGPPDKIARVRELIRSFDTEDTKGSSVIHIVPLANQSAATLAETVRTMLPPARRGEAQEITIQADMMTNSLLVRAPEKKRKTVEELIKKLDAVIKPTREMRIIPVQFTPAYQIAQAVTTMFQPTSTSRRGRTATAADPADQVIVTASPDDKSVVVDAPTRKIADIEKLVKSLDSAEQLDDVQIRTYQLANANAADLSQSLGQMFRAQWDQQRRKDPKNTPPMASFQPDAASNQLIVGATAKQFVQIEKLIQQLENDSKLAAKTQTIRLQFVRCTELVPVLEQMLAASSTTSGRSRYAAAPSAQGQLRIAAMPAINAVVLRGPNNQVLKAQELIRQFDTEDAAGSTQIHMVKLKNANATSVAATLGQLVAARGRTSSTPTTEVVIQADALTNSILIRAPQSERKTIEEMIAKLDAQTEMVRELRVIPLKNTSATMLAETLRTMYAQYTPQTTRGRTTRAVDPSEEIIITAAPSDEAVVVEAPAKKVEEIAKLVTTLDVEDNPNKLTVRTYQLSDEADPAQLAQSLSRLYTQDRQRRGTAAEKEPQPRFEGDATTKKLIVAATGKQFENLDKLIKDLDGGGRLASQIKTFRLKFTKAGELLPTLQTMLVGSSSSYGYRRGGSAPQAAEVRVSAVTATNSIVVQGPPTKLALAEELIKNFDTPEAAKRIIIQIVKLENSQAVSLAEAVNASIAKQAASASSRYSSTPTVSDERVIVTAEPNSNSLLVRGPAEDVPAVIEMIKSIDKGGTSLNVQVRVFPLENSDAAELSKSIGQLFRDITRQQSSGRTKVQPPPFSVTADPRTNSLVISTTTAHFTIVEMLLKSLDQAKMVRDVKYVLLENADAKDVAAKLTALYVDRRGVDKPVIEADEWTNTVTVIAKDADMPDIESVIGKLDKASKEKTIRVVPVARIKAEKMAELIKRIYSQTSGCRIIVTDKLSTSKPGELRRPPAGGGGTILVPTPGPALPAKATAPTTRPATTRPAATTQPTAADEDNRPTITIAVDPLSNSLIISGTRKELENLQNFIDQYALDDASGEAEFRTFRVEKANPVSVAETLERLFNPKPQKVVIPKGSKAQPPPPPPPVITVVPDLRTRTVIVRAKPLDFEIIEPLIKHLDSAALGVSELRVFPLENTDAAELAKNIKELFQLATMTSAQTPSKAPASTAGKKGTPQRSRADSLRQMIEMTMKGGASTTVDPTTSVSITANTHTNSLIVSAPADMMKLVEKIVQELDQSAGLTKKPVVTMYPLKNVEVEPTVTALQTLFAPRTGTTTVRRTTTGGTASQIPVIITGDDAGRRVIVSAAKDKQELIARVIEEMDQAQGGGKVSVKVYKLKNADATGVATALTATLTSGAARGGRTRTGGTGTAATVGPRISADRGSNCIVARAAEEDHVRIAKLIDEMDVSETEKYPIQMIPLTNADPTAVAQILTRVFASTSAGGRRATAAGGRPGLIIEPDVDSRLIMVRADEPTFMKIRELAGKLDTAAVGKAKQSVIALKFAQATSVATALTQAFSPRRAGRTRTATGATGAADTVTVVAEPNSNSIIVTANDDDLKKVQSLLEKLDTETAGGMQTELLVLENARAADLAIVLGRITAAGRGRNQQQGVTVSPDAASNTLVIAGPAGDVGKIIKMARQLDQSAAAQKLPGTYILSLTEGDAGEASQLVQTLYTQMAAVARRDGKSIDPLAVTADQKANALVLATTQKMFDQVQEWVAKLEKMKKGTNTPHIIQLVNADPNEVQKAIQTVFSAASAAAGRGRTTSATPVQIAVLSEQRAILVRATQKDLATIQDLVKKLDAQVPTGKAARTIIALKHARAGIIATSLSGAFATRRGETRAPDEQVTIAAEPMSNSIIVTANAVNLAKVQSLLLKLDTEEAGTKTQFMLLTNAKAAELSQVLARVLPRRAGQEAVAISPDPASNALVIAGPAAEVAKVMKMAKDLDQAATEGSTGVYIITLKNGQATGTASTIQQLYQQQQLVARTEGKSVDPLAVTADEQANSLILATTAKMYKQVTEWVTKLEAMKVGSDVPHIITLKNADPTEVQNAITTVFGAGGGATARRGRFGMGSVGTGTGKVQIAVLTEQRALLVKASKKDFEAIQTLVKALDDAVPAGKATRTIIPVKNTEAASLATALTRAFTPRRGETVRPEDLVSIAAEPLSNSIIVTANQENLTRVQALLTKLDTEESGTKMQIVMLKNAKAVELMPVLSRVLPRRTGQPSAVVSADAASNALLVSGPAVEVAKILAMAAELDKAATGSATAVYIVALENGEAVTTATMVEQLYRQQSTAARAAGQSIDPLAVTADEQANSLVLATTEKMYKQVTAWVAKVEAMKAGSGTPHLIPLTNADPVEVELAVRTAFITQSTRRAGQPPSKIQLTVLTQQRALLVRAPDKDLLAIRELVARLDAEAPAGKATRTIIPLKAAQADGIAAAITRAFSPAPGTRQNPDERVVVAAEPMSNSVIVTANKENLAKVQSLLTKLDTPDAGVATQFMLLKNARAIDLAPVLSRVLTSQRGTGKTPVTVSADGASNALVMSGPANELTRIMVMAQELDQAATTASTGVYIITLKNGEAEETASMIQELYTQQVAAARREQRSVEPLSVTADSQANALVLATTETMHKRVTAWVAKIEEMKPGRITPKIITLVNADAAEVQRAIEQIFIPGRQGRGGQTVGKIQIAALPQQQALLVKAGAEDFTAISELAKSLDKAGTGAQASRTLIQLKHAQAAAVATALSQAFTPPRGRTTTVNPNDQVTVVAESFSNALLVMANEKNLAKVRTLVTQLDTEQAGPTARFVILKNAKAAEIATVLSRVVSSRSRTGQPVTVSADVASNSLVLSGPSADLQRIELMARDLDLAAIGTSTKRTILPLKHAKAPAIAAAMTQAFAPSRGTVQSGEDLVRVTAEPSSNTIIVTANDENLAKVKSLLTTLDTEESSGTQSQMLLLKNARATDVLPVLTEIARAGQPRGGTSQLAMSADAGSNALIMAGPKNELARMMTMAQQLDQAGVDTLPSVHIIQLKNGDAVTVASTVQQLYNQMSASARKGGQSIDPLAVSSDPRANALIIATSKQMFTQVSEWVQQVETMKPARGRLRVIPIEFADPDEVDKAIKQLYEPSGARAPAGRTGATAGSGRVEATVLPQQRAILIDASDEDYEAILKLVKSLEAAAAKQKRTVKVFQLKKANNARLATALTAMFRSVARKGVEEDQVTVTALAQTNAVVVAANKERMTEVTALIEQLDKEDVSPDLEFRIFPLKHAQPAKVLPALQQMIQQLQRIHPDKPISVQADARTRTIIVTAQAKLFDQIGRLIDTLDKQPADPEAQVLIIPLKKADAPRLAGVLQEMLRPASSTQVTPEARELQEQIRLLNVHRVGKEKIPQLDLRKPIKISSDPAQPDQQGSNCLIVSSTKENLQAMQAVVEIMDVVPLAEGVRVRVIRLKNADVTSAMSVLRQMFDQAVQSLSGKPKTSVAGKAEPENTAGKGLVNPVAMAADTRTNTLILSGTEESLALAELILVDLDRVEGQIVTEVRVFALKHADVTRLQPVLTSVFAETNAVPATEGVTTQVTRLKSALSKGKPGSTTLFPKAHPALTIQMDQSTNILIVAARSDVMPLIADVVKTMDIPGAGVNSVRIVPLQNAEATRIQTMLESMYTGPNAALMRADEKPTIAVDTRTNALVISASEKTFAILDALVTRLDQKTPIEMREIRLIALKNAEAATLGPTLQKMMDARVQRQASLGVKDAESLRVIVAQDPRSNSLIVGGSAEGFKLVKELAEQLDGAEAALAGTIQLYPLKEGNAGTLASTMSNLFDARYQAARTAEMKNQKPIILPDLRTNSLLVAANADDTKVFAALLKKLDVKLVDPAIKLVVITMKHNDAGVIGPVIERTFANRLKSMTPPGATAAPQDQVNVSVDALTNAMIVSASKENLALIAELLKKVDVEPPDETGIVRMYPLQNSDAQRVSTLLEGLISKGLYKPGMVAAGTNPALAAREKVAIVVDIRTNVLIVSASKENFAVIEEIIKRIDSSEDYSVLGDIKMFVLKRADATRLAQTLQQLFSAKRQAETAAGSSGRSLPVSIIPDPRTNTLLIAGSRESFATAEALIKRLDGEEVIPANEYRVFILKHATATALQPTLERLFSQRVSRGTTKDAVTVIADGQRNTLVVGATPEDMKIVESVIKRMDIPPDATGKTVHVFPLKKADAKQIAESLQNLYRTQGAGDAVKLTVDERINAVVVSAGDADVKRIRDLIDQLDIENVSHVTEIRVFPLKNADATELSQILTSVLANKPKPIGVESANRATILQFITASPGGKELISQAMQEGLLIIPDPRTNALVVSAPVKNMPLLDHLITALDSTDPQLAEIRVFTLKNADARQLVEVLQQLFRLQGGASSGQRAFSYTLVSTTQPAGGAKTSGKPSASAKLGTAQQSALSITVDSRTNSLIVGGTKQYVALASEVIQELDASPIQERQTKLYRLRNAQAVDIQTALRTFLDQERQKLTQVLGSDSVGAAQRLLEREVAVVAEATTNTLLLSASPRYFVTVARIIEELDQPPPQVLIQVLLAEVTLDDTTDLGFEWNYQHEYRRKDGTVRRTLNTGSALGVQAAINTFGGFSATLTGDDMNFYLRALQSTGKVELLSRPQVLASDNQVARINVGQRVPFVRNTRISDQGSVFNTIEYEDVGVILEVTPRINPDGFVKLVVAPEISSLTTSSVQISEGVNAPIINSRKATTTVTVQDGHTIVIGGLITTQDEERQQKIPIIGDIPGVGLLFRTNTTIKNRTELLIILTPHVLRNIGDSDTITDRQLKRLDLLRKMQRDALKEYLFRPDDSTEIRGDVRYPRSESMKKSGVISLEEWAEKEKNGRGKPTTRPAATAPATDDKNKPPATKSAKPAPAPDLKKRQP